MQQVNLNKIFMRKINIIPVILFAVLASCSGKTDTSANGNADLAQKKAKLEQLKKQQDDLTKQIVSLQAEIIKQDPSANPEKAKLVAVEKLSTDNFQHYIDLQGKVDAQNIAYVTSRNPQPPSPAWPRPAASSRCHPRDGSGCTG